MAYKKLNYEELTTEELTKLWRDSWTDDIDDLVYEREVLSERIRIAKKERLYQPEVITGHELTKERFIVNRYKLFAEDKDIFLKIADGDFKMTSESKRKIEK